MKKSKHHKIIFPLVALITLAAIFLYPINSGDSETLKVNTTSYSVEIADTPQKRAQGLMHRQHLPDGHGMLFVYPESGRPNFWMKNTLISLDFLWIGEDLIVKHIHENITPCAPKMRCDIYSSPIPVKYILELPAGSIKTNAHQVGDKITLPSVL